MISRIAPLLLLATGVSAEPPAAPLIVDTGTARVVTFDLTEPAPEGFLSRLRQELEDELRAAPPARARRDQIEMAQGLIELAGGNFRKSSLIFRGIGSSSLLYDAARFYRAQALRSIGEQALRSPPKAASLTPCQEARALLQELMETSEGPFAESLGPEFRRATHCYVHGLVDLRRYGEAKKLIEHLLSAASEFDAAGREFLYVSLVRILKSEGLSLDARRVYEEARLSLPRRPDLENLAADLPPLPPPDARPTASVEQPPTQPAVAQDEALFRTALKEISKKELKEGTETLVRLQADFPGSIAARKAAARLRVLANSLLGEKRPPPYFLKAVKKLPPEALYSLSRSIWEDGRDAQAGELFRHIAETSPPSPLLGNVHYSLGRIEENKRNFREARTHFETVVTAHSGSGFYDRSYFKVGWLSFLLGEDEKARTWLEADRARVQDPTLIAQDLYWLSKVLDRQGKPAEAKKYLQSIRSVAPLSYYAFLSEQLPSPAEAAPLKEAVVRTYWNAYRLNRARAFLACGLPSAAAWNLRAFDLDADPGAAEEFALLSLHAGRYAAAFSLAFPLAVPTPEGGLSRRLLEILFPRPFEATVRAEAAPRNLDPLLVFALIKQESAFQEDAESRAGARGLMQLMPGTARNVAKELGEEQPEGAALFSGPTNLRLGTQHLAGLLKYYSGNVIFSLAAYNAGTHRVDLWINPWKDLRPDVFVEAIPFEETRNYVKAISRNYALYAKLSDGRALRLEDLAGPANK